MTDNIPEQPVPTAAPAAAAPVRRPGWWVTPTLAIVAALIVGGVAGVAIGQATASTNTASDRRGFGGQFSGQFGEGGFPGGAATGGTGGYGAGGYGGGAAGNFTRGKITAISGDTITITTTDGKSVTVTTTGSTTVTKTSAAKVSDLASGETITVRGTSSGDSVAATSITEGATGFGGGPTR